MYIISYLTGVVTMMHYSLTFNSAKLEVLNRFTEAPRDNFKFGGILNYFTLCLTDNLTMTNFFTYQVMQQWFFCMQLQFR